jgi:rhodanese-related sulfurtransferase
MGTVARMLALVGLGAMIGAADSWIRPVQLRLNPQGPSESQVPVAAPAPATPGEGTARVTAAADKDPAATAAGTAAATEQLGLEITVDQAKALYDQGVTFLDARLDEEYNAERVSGAQQLTTAMFGLAEPPAILNMLDPAAPVVIYCSGGDCDASHSVGIRLQQAGFEKIHIMRDGLPGWKTSGHPVETGPADAGG